MVDKQLWTDPLPSHGVHAVAEYLVEATDRVLELLITINNRYIDTSFVLVSILRLM